MSLCQDLWVSSFEDILGVYGPYILGAYGVAFGLILMLGLFTTRSLRRYRSKIKSAQPFLT